MDETQYGLMIEMKVDSRSLALAQKDFKAYAKGAHNITMQTLMELGQDIVNQAIQLVPTDTGRLKQSIHYETQKIKGGNYKDDVGNTYNNSLGIPLRDLEVIAGTNVEYADYIENGRGPFEINSPVYIKKNGKHIGWRFIKTHPGIKAIHFLKRAFDMTVQNFEKGLRNNLYNPERVKKNQGVFKNTALNRSLNRVGQAR